MSATTSLSPSMSATTSSVLSATLYQLPKDVGDVANQSMTDI
jgi:hypothetical protein